MRSWRRLTRSSSHWPPPTMPDLPVVMRGRHRRRDTHWHATRRGAAGLRAPLPDRADRIHPARVRPDGHRHPPARPALDRRRAGGPKADHAGASISPHPHPRGGRRRVAARRARASGDGSPRSHDPRPARRATALSAPVLSTIPASSAANLATLAAPGSARDSVYRRLAARASPPTAAAAIVVTSPVGRMQDSVAANFAAALAGLGLRVALVATEPSQSWYADPDEQAEALTFPDFLATAHAGHLNGHVRDGMMSTPFENLRVIPHGEASADALLDGLPPLLLAMAENDIDVTVIAAPAMLEESNATILAWSTRSVLWVVESGEVTEHEAHEAAERLALAGASPFGVAVVAGAGGWSGRTSAPLEPGDRLRIPGTATRALGPDLLVNVGGATAPVHRLTGSGPALWRCFRDGSTLSDTTEQVAQDTGTTVDLEPYVVRFATWLLDARLAERALIPIGGRLLALAAGGPSRRPPSAARGVGRAPRRRLRARLAGLLRRARRLARSTSTHSSPSGCASVSRTRPFEPCSSRASSIASVPCWRTSRSSCSRVPCSPMGSIPIRCFARSPISISSSPARASRSSSWPWRGSATNAPTRAHRRLRCARREGARAHASRRRGDRSASQPRVRDLGDHDRRR